MERLALYLCEYAFWSLPYLLQPLTLVMASNSKVRNGAVGLLAAEAVSAALFLASKCSLLPKTFRNKFLKPALAPVLIVQEIYMHVVLIMFSVAVLVSPVRHGDPAVDHKSPLVRDDGVRLGGSNVGLGRNVAGFGVMTGLMLSLGFRVIAISTKVVTPENGEAYRALRRQRERAAMAGRRRAPEVPPQLEPEGEIERDFTRRPRHEAVTTVADRSVSDVPLSNFGTYEPFARNLSYERAVTLRSVDRTLPAEATRSYVSRARVAPPVLDFMTPPGGASSALLPRPTAPSFPPVVPIELPASPRRLRPFREAGRGFRSATDLPSSSIGGTAASSPPAYESPPAYSECFF